MNNLFLKDELPIRLAHRIYDLINLPYGLPLVNIYMNYINGLIKINPIKNYGTQVFLYFPKKIDFYEKKI